MVILAVACLAGGYGGLGWLRSVIAPSPSSPISSTRPSPKATVIDWTQVALELIRQPEQDWQKLWEEERAKRRELEQELLHLKIILSNTPSAPLQSRPPL